MTEIIELNRVKTALQNVDVIGAIEPGFRAYSRGEVVVPPVGELIFEDPPREAHTKHGYIKNAPFSVIKIASGLCHNPALGLSSSLGLLLVFRVRASFKLDFFIKNLACRDCLALASSSTFHEGKSTEGPKFFSAWLRVERENG